MKMVTTMMMKVGAQSCEQKLILKKMSTRMLVNGDQSREIEDQRV